MALQLETASPKSALYKFWLKMAMFRILQCIFNISLLSPLGTFEQPKVCVKFG